MQAAQTGTQNLLAAVAAMWAMFAGYALTSIWGLYFGNRQPYCNRSVNMDKWSDPWPGFFVEVLGSGLLVLVVVVVLHKTRGSLAFARRNVVGGLVAGLMVGSFAALLYSVQPSC